MELDVERVCPVCAVRYFANETRLRFGRQTTCSRECSYKLRASKLDKGEQCKCAACSADVRLVPSRKALARHGESFCSPACAYSRRKRVVERPYVLVADVDRSEAMRSAWVTRRANARPYPESARQKARADAVAKIIRGGSVSRFERAVARTFRDMGFEIQTGVSLRRSDGTHAHVFDIVLPSRRIAIECHGDFWHGGRWTWDEPSASQRKNLAFEERKMCAARAVGFDVRLLWERNFRSDPTGSCLASVR